MPSEISPDVIIFAASISACERGSQWQKVSWKFLRFFVESLFLGSKLQINQDI